MNITAELLHVTPMELLVRAIRQCYESGDNSDSGYGTDGWYVGSKDKALIERVINSGHTSTLEHINFNFQIKGISRLNLQELARHRMTSLSVKSSRYTLKELKSESSFIDFGVPEPEYYFKDASKYINFTGIPKIDEVTIFALEELRKLIVCGEFTNDEAKYALPECYKTDLIWTINARSLRNFLTLRTSKRAHFEIRELAQKIYDAIPEMHKFLFDGCVEL